MVDVVGVALNTLKGVVLRTMSGPGREDHRSEAPPAYHVRGRRRAVWGRSEELSARLAGCPNMHACAQEPSQEVSIIRSASFGAVRALSASTVGLLQLTPASPDAPRSTFSFTRGSDSRRPLTGRCFLYLRGHWRSVYGHPFSANVDKRFLAPRHQEWDVPTQWVKGGRKTASTGNGPKIWKRPPTRHCQLCNTSSRNPARLTLDTK